VAFVFMGWSVASAFGVPAMSLVGAHAGWRIAYFTLAAASGIAAVASASQFPAPSNRLHCSEHIEPGRVS
jgi:predicted MFS family arabinose efflux permease